MIIMLIITVICALFLIFPIIGHIMYYKYDKAIDRLPYRDGYEAERSKLYTKREKWSWLDDLCLFSGDLSAITFIAIAAFLFGAVLPFMCAHIGTTVRYNELEIERAGLIADYEYCMEYHPKDTTDIFYRVAEFDKKIYDAKYYLNNPWTSWYCNPKINDVDYILLNEENLK